MKSNVGLIAATAIAVVVVPVVVAAPLFSPTVSAFLLWPALVAGYLIGAWSKR